MPTGVSATAGVESVTVTWQPSTSTIGISGYNLYRDGARVATVSSTGFTDGGLSAATTYSYTVAAVDTLGTVSAQSSPVTATPTAPAPPPPTGGGPQTTWAPAGTLPLSDAQAAALVTHRPEQRSGNVEANDYVPTQAEVEAFHAARNSYGEPTIQWNPLYAYVDGRDGLTNPSTDDLIQWGAHKWGIPEEWLRAEYAQESWWRQSQLGDLATVSTAWFAEYPLAARLSSCCSVYQSMGITQVKWIPDGSVGAGTEPLRWESTAFNIDYQAATIRYYYDGRCSWCTSGYGPGQAWASIGAWFSPYPWNNSGAQSYVKSVQGYVETMPWTKSGF